MTGVQTCALPIYEANEALGLPSDGRDYTAAAQMLSTLGARRIELLSNNPDKAKQLAAHGIEIQRKVPTGVFVTPTNLRYLQTKVNVTGHQILLDGSGAPTVPAAAA